MLLCQGPKELTCSGGITHQRHIEVFTSMRSSQEETMDVEEVAAVGWETVLA